MKFIYKTVNKALERKDGEIEAPNLEAAITLLQQQGATVSSIKPKEEAGTGSLLSRLGFHKNVANKEIVVLSRQIAILFQSQISALKVFQLLMSDAENPTLRRGLQEIVNDLQGGVSISNALSKHPNIFSNFYINMVRAGEQTGKIADSFEYLATYLDRNYEITHKAKNALVYPAFVIFTFFAVMVLMFTVIIPKIGVIIRESGQEIPIYTSVVLDISDFFVAYWYLVLLIIVGAVAVIYWYVRTPEGARWIANFRLGLPVLGELYRKLYLSRFADNMSVMVVSGIPILKAIEVTSAVIDNEIYSKILGDCYQQVKAGRPLSAALSDTGGGYVPKMLTQMVRAGEESGNLGKVLETMASFYQREVVNTIDAMVGLIEPIMIVTLGLGVGILLASVLTPIYNLAGSVS